MKYYIQLTLLYIKREWLMFQLISVVMADNILNFILKRK